MQNLRKPDCEPNRFGHVAIVVLGLFLATFVVSAQPATSEEVPKDAEDKVVFVPPPIGAPADRITAGTRSAQPSSNALAFLSPKAGGYTTNPQPTLYWFLPRPYRGTLNLVVTEVATEPQVANGTISVDLSKGLYALNFSQMNFSLRSGRIYLVALDLSDAKQGPLQSSTYVEVVDLNLDEEKTIASFAKRGLRFDAIDAGMRTAHSGLATVIDKEKMLELFSSAGVAIPWIE